MSRDHTVEDADDDIRLDRWFKRHYPGIPHALLEKHLRKGAIRVDGKKAKSNDRIRAGQIVRCPPVMNEKRPKIERKLDDATVEQVKRWVLYKDDRIIIVNKPAGLAVQGGSKIDRNLDEMLPALAFENKEKPKLVHRLDRDTSGCLVLARNAKVATALMRLFSGREVEKTYLALVNGLPDPMAGTIDLPMQKKENPKASGEAGGPEGRDYEVVQVDEEGQKAITEYRVRDHLSRKFALVELMPLTGRMHQLRVHMASIGCPIVGDHKYGGGTDAAKAVGVANQLHLHAWRIALPPFAGGKGVKAAAPLPEHMQKSFAGLGIDQVKN